MSLFIHPLNLGQSCDVLWLIKYGESDDVMPVLS